MENKKYQVFISSTYTDLIVERKKVLEVILAADCIPAGMEAFVATDDEQFEVIKSVIDLCDYYILIIGGRYGLINSKTDLSYTEMEYDYAVEKGIPVLVFAIDEAVPLSNDKKETEREAEARLLLFRKKALNNRLASIWNSTDDLALKVGLALSKAKIEIPMPGWQRYKEDNEAELLRQVVELQEENIRLKEDLEKRKSESLIENPENEISLTLYGGGGFSSVKKIKLAKCFEVIGLSLLEGAKTSDEIERILADELNDSNSYNPYWLDDSDVKRLLVKFEALGLLDSLLTGGWIITGNGKKQLAQLSEF